MNVLLINGSPHAHGCTQTALDEVAAALNREGVATETLWLGTQPIAGCIGCGACRKNGGRCFRADLVNEAAEKAAACDGLVLGSPVHYAAASGAMTAFLDRLFYCASARLAGKPCACVVSARRAGTTAAIDQLLKYPLFAGMPIVSSQYWTMVHGNTPDEVRQDAEGLQIMRTLGRNMAWLLKSIEAGRAAGLTFPEREPRVATNFIRPAP